MTTSPGHDISLDDLYVMTSHMYGHRNEERPASATFAHFVEVCAALTGQARSKRRESLDTPGALCKALAWFFPLMAKLGVRSVEDLVFRKYPYACPYCRRAPHSEIDCKIVMGTDATVNHSDLRQLHASNAHRKPTSLDDWRRMFADIYPRQFGDVAAARSALGLFEELGELSEAVRVFERHPKYLAGEAADVFSYLMAMATEYDLAEQLAGRPPFSLQAEYLRRYPGLCPQCGYHVCVCPPVPASTVGRTAKELDVLPGEALFGLDLGQAAARASRVAQRVVNALGGYQGLLGADAGFPFDRGDANRNLVMLLMRVAESVQDADPAAAESLRAAALRAAAHQAAAGTSAGEAEVAAILDDLRAVPGALAAATAGPPLIFDPTADGRLAPPSWRVLVATAGPDDEIPLALRAEQNRIGEAIRRSQHREAITATYVSATTMTGLRRVLLDQHYDIVLLSGHGHPSGPLLEDDDGVGSVLTLDRLKDLMAQSPSVKCLILNVCYAGGSLSAPIAPLTVGMTDLVGDEAAIAFSEGFFDALGAGRTLDDCVEHGRMAAGLVADPADLPLVVLGKQHNAPPAATTS